MTNCTHKPIKSQVSISKGLYEYIFNDIKYTDPIVIVYFGYYPKDERETVYIDKEYSNSHGIHNNETLILFNHENEEDLKVVTFFDDIIKMCKQCFFEYLNKYNLTI